MFVYADIVFGVQTRGFQVVVEVWRAKPGALRISLIIRIGF